MVPAQPPLPTAWNFRFQPADGSQTSILMSESLDGVRVAATRQNSGRAVGICPGRTAGGRRERPGWHGLGQRDPGRRQRNRGKTIARRAERGYGSHNKPNRSERLHGPPRQLQLYSAAPREAKASLIAGSFGPGGIPLQPTAEPDGAPFPSTPPRGPPGGGPCSGPCRFPPERRRRPLPRHSRTSRRA